MSRRPIDATTGLARTRASMGDGTVRGKARIATPYDRRRLRTAARSGGSSARDATPLGHTVTLRAAAVTSTGKVTWGEVVRGSGFITELPDPQVRVRGYYDVDVSIDAGGEVMRDVVVAVTIGETVATDACPFATSWAGTIPDVLAERGDVVEVSVSWTGAASVSVMMTVGLDEPLAQLSVEEPPPCCFLRVAVGTGVNDSQMPNNPASTNDGALGDLLPDGRVGYAYIAGGEVRVAYAASVEAFLDYDWPTVVYDQTLQTGLIGSSNSASFTVDGSRCWVMAAYKLPEETSGRRRTSVWYSDDAGVTWSSEIMLLDLPGTEWNDGSFGGVGTVHRLASGTLLASGPSQEVYCVGGDCLINPYAGVWRSTDNGDTWTLVFEGKDGVVGGGYTANPPSGYAEDEGTIIGAYTGYYAGGRYYRITSTDDGQTWNSLRLTLSEPLTLSTAIGDPCGDLDAYRYGWLGPDRGEIAGNPCSEGMGGNAVRLRKFDGLADFNETDSELITTIPEPGSLGSVALSRSASRVSRWGQFYVVQFGGWTWHSSAEGV